MMMIWSLILLSPNPLTAGLILLSIVLTLTLSLINSLTGYLIFLVYVSGILVMLLYLTNLLASLAGKVTWSLVILLTLLSLTLSMESDSSFPNLLHLPTSSLLWILALLLLTLGILTYLLSTHQSLRHLI